MISRLFPQFLLWELPVKLPPSIITSILMSLHQRAAYQDPAAALLLLDSLPPSLASGGRSSVICIFNTTKDAV